jgi:hypothetical protein
MKPDEKGTSSISGWWFQTNFIFHNKTGMSSFPLTKSIIFQDGYFLPPTSTMEVSRPWGSPNGRTIGRLLSTCDPPRFEVSNCVLLGCSGEASNIFHLVSEVRLGKPMGWL